MRMFNRIRLSDYLEQFRSDLSARVKAEKDSYILNVEIEEYISFLCSEYRVEFIIDFDNFYATEREEDIPSEKFPTFNFSVPPGKRYSKQVIKYHIPFSGDQRILEAQPSCYSSYSPQAEINDSEITFDIINFYDDVDKINQESDNEIKSMKIWYQNLKNDIDAYNACLPDFAKSVITERQAVIKKKSGIVNGLKAPLRKTDDIPSTFSVPSVRKKILPKPVIEKGKTEIHPTLSGEVYNEILKVINDMGKSFEKHPNTYKGKDENTLRDHILILLENHFEGTSASGETFNKSGKTDIIVKHEANNIFIAECKFWGGEKVNTETINQLLGYLTWRDTKTAIVYFVKNKEISPILKKIKEFTEGHPNFVSYDDNKEDSWFSFTLHIENDPESKFKLTILLFHLPE